MTFVWFSCNHGMVVSDGQLPPPAVILSSLGSWDAQMRGEPAAIILSSHRTSAWEWQRPLPQSQQTAQFSTENEPTETALKKHPTEA